MTSPPQQQLHTARMLKTGTRHSLNYFRSALTGLCLSWSLGLGTWSGRSVQPLPDIPINYSSESVNHLLRFSESLITHSNTHTHTHTHPSWPTSNQTSVLSRTYQPCLLPSKTQPGSHLSSVQVPCSLPAVSHKLSFALCVRNIGRVSMWHYANYTV